MKSTRILSLSFVGLVLLAAASCKSGADTGGNPFTIRFFTAEGPDPVGEAVDCAPLSFSPHTPQCLFGPPPQVATPGEIPEGDYHLTSFEGPACNTPWIDAAMRVQKLSDGRLYVKERRSTTASLPPATQPELLDAMFFVDPKVSPTPPKAAHACREATQYVPEEFTVIDSYVDAGKPVVVIRVKELYVLVYTHD